MVDDVRAGLPPWECGFQKWKKLGRNFSDFEIGLDWRRYSEIKVMKCNGFKAQKVGSSARMEKAAGIDFVGIEIDLYFTVLLV